MLSVKSRTLLEKIKSFEYAQDLEKISQFYLS